MAWDGLPSLQPFAHPLPLDLGSGSDTLEPQCGLLIIELSYLVKSSNFNMSMPVKTVELLSNKMFYDVTFLMTMHVCEEQLSHFLVFFSN